MPMTVEELLEEAEKKILDSSNVDLWRRSDALVNAEELLSEILGKTIETKHLDDAVPPAAAARFRRSVERRAGGEPVALILGYTEFRGMKLIVEPGTFVPRNSSELLAVKAIKRVKPKRSGVAVDVATGTGPVALAIAKAATQASVLGLDIWAPSIKVARKNARQLSLTNVKFIESDMLKRLPKNLKGAVDVFTIHPPYVAKKAVKTLPKEIKDFEPAVSLTDNSVDGLGLVRTLAGEAPSWLRKGGWMLVEVSPDLARSVGTILRRAGFGDVRSEKDSLGATRVISGRI
ncbi:MAG: class I SAM-dependent methyltransferase [Actinomycetota bacterium]|nr:peptide chain release factor N(5)-glutamine methyltransferase [Actinomycetota bacterium]